MTNARPGPMVERPSRLRHWFRRARRGWEWRERRAATPVMDTPLEWRLFPTLPRDEICLFLTYAAGGKLAAHALHHARQWATAGFGVILVIIVDDMAGFRPDTDLGFAAGVMVRRNEGYDFGAWAAAIRGLPDLRRARLLAIVNDSIYGPLDSFPRMLSRVRASRADLIGAIESHIPRHHYQSFLLFFGARALRSRAFWRFWRRVRNGGRDFVIEHYETRLLGALRRGGLRAETLFATSRSHGLNRTLDDWRGLIREGFPFVKTRLLRENPLSADISDWKTVMGGAGYETTLIDEHLGARHRE